MALTVLAGIFLFFVLLMAIFGQRILSQKTASVKNPNRETCSVCQNVFDKGTLIERQIGDFKMMFFCPQCIEHLYNDMKKKLTQ